MQKRMKKSWCAFLLTFASCTLLFCGILFLQSGISPSKEVAQPYTSAPYSPAYSKGKTAIFIKIEDLSVCFLLEWIPSQSSGTVTCIPKASVKESTKHLSPNPTLPQLSDFFTTDIDFTITMSQEIFSHLFEQVGGISAPTPYGLPAPSQCGAPFTTGETVQLYGHTFLDLIKAEPAPDTQRLLYYANLFSLLCKAYLTDFIPEKYHYIKENANTNISYIHYYDHRSEIERCAAALSVRSCDGVWLNEHYYLQ